MADTAILPLFPLHTVLFPGGPLALRIFEPRYLDMVSRCLREDSGFGVCLIREGGETGAPAVTWEVGTLARIRDWDRGEDGLLSITVLGERRFRIRTRSVRPDRLAVAEVEYLSEPPATPVPEEYQHLAQLLARVIAQVGAPYSGLAPCFQDAAWVGGRFAELLPIPLEEKQRLLERNDPLERLAALAGMISP